MKGFVRPRSLQIHVFSRGFLDTSPGSGLPLRRYTPAEITVIAIQSIAEGHSASTGIARSAVVASVSATKAAPARHPVA